MRKMIVCVALLVFLSGCSKGAEDTTRQPLASHSGNYETSALISYKGLEATATLAQDAPGSCALNFTAPQSLKDMAFVFQRDSMSVSYKGMAFQFDPDSLPGSAVAGMVVSAINKSMQDDGITMNRTEQGVELTGMLDVGEFTLRLDPESGNLLKLSVPSEELEIAFENFRFLD